MTEPSSSARRRECAQRVVEQHAPGSRELEERRRTGSRDHLLEPALEDVARHVSRRGREGRRRRSGWAPSPRSPSRPRGRPSALRGRSCARPASSDRAPRGGRSQTRAAPSGARASRAPPYVVRGTRQHRRSTPCVPPSARVIAFAMYWTASMVCPCLPMKSATSGPLQLTVTPPSCSRAETVTSAAIPTTMRSTISPASRDASLASPAAGSVTPVVPALAMTCAGREADPQKPALAFRDDLELHALAVEAGHALLELSERSPLRLADRLTRRLDGHGLLVAHRRVLPPRLRFTRRGAPPELPRTAGVGVALSPLPAGSGSSFGGVRLERFGGAVGLASVAA